MPSALSPTPTKKPEKGSLDFNKAIAAIIGGKKIHKLEWGDKKYYCVLKDGRLKHHKPDGQFYDWVIQEGDLLGEDWVVV